MDVAGKGFQVSENPLRLHTPLHSWRRVHSPRALSLSERFFVRVLWVFQTLQKRGTSEGRDMSFKVQMDGYSDLNHLDAWPF